MWKVGCEKQDRRSLTNCINSHRDGVLIFEIDIFESCVTKLEYLCLVSIAFETLLLLKQVIEACIVRCGLLGKCQPSLNIHLTLSRFFTC